MRSDDLRGRMTCEVPMIRWLHRYIFRGLGLLFVIGMVTLFLLAVISHEQHPGPRRVAPASR